VTFEKGAKFNKTRAKSPKRSRKKMEGGSRPMVVEGRQAAICEQQKKWGGSPEDKELFTTNYVTTIHTDKPAAYWYVINITVGCWR
jgi:hypothetical protein